MDAFLPISGILTDCVSKSFRGHRLLAGMVIPVVQSHATNHPSSERLPDLIGWRPRSLSNPLDHTFRLKPNLVCVTAKP